MELKIHTNRSQIIVTAIVYNRLNTAIEFNLKLKFYSQNYTSQNVYYVNFSLKNLIKIFQYQLCYILKIKKENDIIITNIFY